MIVAALVFLSTLAMAALAYGILEPRFQRDKTAKNRLAQYRASETDAAMRQVARDRLNEVAKRRKSLQSSLTELEEKARERGRKAAHVSIERRLQQAGLDGTLRGFVIVSVALGLAAGLVVLVVGLSPLFALAFAVICGLGVPRWVLSFLRKRRQAKFVLEFANAIDVVVRGIRSGLPLNDTLRMIAHETPEPVRSEFARVVEAQQMGMSVSEAVQRLNENMPLPETNFFAIVVSIQSQSGGNLGEALSNLSKVLRERRRMKDKIKAMSMEAKASAYIIGSLPVIVGFLVYLTSPDYISLLFTESLGNLILGGAVGMMATGIFVMRQMITFDF
ncbi:type II secretion system F family protein [Aureimonas pseudogalii]|uniref:Tight adherence protein B n=1 Tax=Aureimonas pseudogalii TaxID=1744844 RepID=A0A7W6EHQ6_9HYPH|nr:type II secretion system F family protein [Aureimonas pseudogalii]MBB3998444.1 tight adherence protein B [Aureimonas pseudogalii]